MNEKFSALKNAPGKEDALVEQYKQLINEILKTRAISDEKKIELIQHGNLAMIALAGPTTPRRVHFDPRTKNPKGTLTSITPFIVKSLCT